MAYDEGLAERVREQLSRYAAFTERKMFGGLCFLVRGHMCCGVLGEELLLRVGPSAYVEALTAPHAREMDFTGKPLKGMVFVRPEGVAEDADLLVWLLRGLDFVQTLPEKT